MLDQNDRNGDIDLTEPPARAVDSRPANRMGRLDGWRRRGGWTFVAGIVAGLLLFVGARYAINRTTLADRLISPLLRDDTAGHADLIVVPGAGVTGSCTPNVSGTRRVLMAARLYRQQRAPAVFFAGGTGDGDCPVAEAMARQAAEVGVPAERIYREISSRSTHENAERSVALLDALGARRLLLVTDRLHMPRAERSFEHYGFVIERASVPIYEGHENNVDMLLAGMREGIALAYYTLRGWVQPRPPRPNPAPVREAAAMTSAWTFPSGPVVLLGASYAAGWHLTSVAGRPMVNAGVAGDESTALLARFPRDVAAASPRAVMLWGFINDIFRAPADINPVLARIRDNYTQMIALARASGIEPILVTEVTTRPRFDSWGNTISNLIGSVLSKASYQDRINAHVTAMNRWIVETAARERLLVLDFQAVLAESGGRRHKPFSQPDGSHITPAGYDALTAYASPLLEEHFREH